MKILSLIVFKNNGADRAPVLLAASKDLSEFSFFTRGTVAEHLLFASRTVCQRTRTSTRQSVGLKDNPFLCHTYVRADHLCGIVISDKEYPQRVAYGLINQFLGEYEKYEAKWKEVQEDKHDDPPFLQEDLKKFQDPKQADKLMRIQTNLDEIKDVMHKNIDQVLKRGENLDELMEKANDLSSTSVTFYKQAKKTNQCCKSY